MLAVNRDDDTVDVLYDDGDFESHVPRERLHGVSIELTDAFHAFSVGDVVKADLKGHGSWYTGRIIAIDTKFRVFTLKYENGHLEKHVPPSRIHPLSSAHVKADYVRGDRVRANWQGWCAPAARPPRPLRPSSRPPLLPLPSQRHVVPRPYLVSQHRRGHLQRPVRRRRARGARARALAPARRGGGDEGGERAAAVRVHALLVGRQERRRDARRARGDRRPLARLDAAAVSALRGQ